MEKKLKEIVTRAYLARPTGKGRVFPWMEGEGYERFVDTVSDMQVQEIMDLFMCDQFVPFRKRSLDEVRKGLEATNKYSKAFIDSVIDGLSKSGEYSKQ